MELLPGEYGSQLGPEGLAIFSIAGGLPPLSCGDLSGSIQSDVLPQRTNVLIHLLPGPGRI